MSSEAWPQSWAAPAIARPIVLIGGGGIVNDAHLPAYRKNQLPVAGVYDIDATRAKEVAAKWKIDRVFASLEEATAQKDVIFDIAVPPGGLFEVVSALPDGSAALLQKPMGVDLTDAKRIRETCRRRKLIAAVNFQLRFTPMMIALKSIIDKGLLGQLVDISFNFNLRTPWELFPFLKKLKRCEILMHTVHHLDFCRHLAGEPKGVYARTCSHPAFPDLASTKSSIILDYGQTLRAALSINHNYEFGPHDECADVRVQGTDGAARISLGLLLNYPQGKPETLEYRTRACADCTQVPVNGRWFPDAFAGIMSNLQRYVGGEDEKLLTAVDDAYRTMALVEACYQSDAAGGTPLPE